MDAVSQKEASANLLQSSSIFDCNVLQPSETLVQSTKGNSTGVHVVVGVALFLHSHGAARVEQEYTIGLQWSARPDLTSLARMRDFALF